MVSGTRAEAMGGRIARPRQGFPRVIQPADDLPWCIIGPERSLAMPVVPGWEGRFYEDFKVGDVYRCRLGRTVTDVDNTWFTLLTNNTNQIHFNNEYAKRTEFGKCLVNSVLTLAIVAGVGGGGGREEGMAPRGGGNKQTQPPFAGRTPSSSILVPHGIPAKN